MTAPAIVVGIDGSAAASRAAVWAVDEAISRDIPLRLVAVPEQDADLSEARSAVQAAAAVVRADGRSVRVETEVVTGAPTLVLLVQMELMAQAHTKWLWQKDLLEQKLSG